MTIFLQFFDLKTASERLYIHALNPIKASAHAAMISIIDVKTMIQNTGSETPRKLNTTEKAPHAISPNSATTLRLKNMALNTEANQLQRVQERDPKVSRQTR